MYTLIGVFFCTLFSTQRRDKHLIALYVVYATLLTYLSTTRVLHAEDYIQFYSVITLVYCTIILGRSEKGFRYAITLIVVTPHIYYLYLLHYPYRIPDWLPFWFLETADTNFGWGVFIILYSKGLVFNMDKLTTREYAVNTAIVLCIILTHL